jgi:hypothetical protein
VIEAQAPFVDPGRRVRVVYIAGAKNCGSTLLDAVLGGAPGACSLGEVGGFHRHENGRPCACGRPAASCDLCTTVCGTVYRAVAHDRFRDISGLPLKERRLHWTLVGTRTRAEYARVADVLFDAVAAATESTVLVDSSKNVARAAALVRDSRHDVRILHLVRDGRGYLRSRRTRARATGERHLAPLALGEWLAKNTLLSGVLARRLPPDRYLLCRYEDLVRDPHAELARIGRFTGLDTSGLADIALADGVERGHLYEPQRRADYRRVRLEPARLESQRWSHRANAAYWIGGGWLSRWWGYDRRQRYLGDDRKALR